MTALVLDRDPGRNTPRASASTSKGRGVAGRAAAAVRADALDALRALGRVDVALACDLRRHQGRWRLVDVVLRGEPASPLPVDLEGFACPEPLGWDPTHPSARGLDRFVGLCVHDVLRDPAARATWSPLVAAFGAFDLAWTALYDDGRLLGVVVVLSRGGAFSARRLRALSARHDALKAAFVEARRLDPEPVSPGASAVLRGDGAVLHACGVARHWLDDDRRAWLARCVGELERGGEPACTLRHGVQAGFVPLYGVDGISWLADLVALPPVRVTSTSVLSGRQREVAELAAVGATNAEIGRSLGMSPQTVASHLKEVYRRLDVSTRLDLAEALRDATT